MTVQTMTEVLEWLLVATAVPTTLFTILYAARSPWWVSAYGRALLASSSAVALLVDMTMWFVLYPPTSLAVAFWVQVAAFSWAALSSTYLLVVLLKAQVKK